MSILKASNFASKMFKENQHTLYKCCRIAADYYGVNVSDVQKELASRAGKKSKGRTPKNKELTLKCFIVKGKITLGKDYSEDIWNSEININVKAYTKENAWNKASKLFLKKYLKGTYIFNPNNYNEIVQEANT